MIWKPNDSIYIFDRQILPISRNMSVIIGEITCKAAPTLGEISEIDYVEWKLDGRLVYTVKEPDEDGSYSWEWKKSSIGNHTLEAIAYYINGDTVSDREEVWIFNS